jgi:UDP-N-acetylmuramyl pentapeptide phosphotransferase/UDP-N-acetylglucosamine-1-phosphate transferase
MLTESYTYLVFVFALSLIGSIACMPILIGIARRKKLFDIPNLRSSHIQLVPRIGGVAFFIVVVVYFIEAREEFEGIGLVCISMGASLLFAIGLYDDVRSVRPLFKLIAQIIALLGIVGFYHDAIDRFRLHSVFECLPPGVFHVLVFCFFLVLINAINLMDGIDGLAALISINFFSVMAVVFYRSNHHHFSILSLVILGSIIAFLFFNFSARNKVFMGDCGSLLLGFLMCSFSLQLMDSSCCDPAMHDLSGNELTFVFLALFSLPVVDLLRVVLIRLAKAKPIFHADRNHLHHLIIDKMGKSHVFTAGLLFVIHLSNILLALFAT